MTLQRGGTVLAALDGGPSSPAILTVAGEVAHMMDGHVEAVYVAEPGTNPPRERARAAGVPLLEMRGEVLDVLLGQTSRADVQATVIGARGTPSGPLPAGHVALALATAAEAPVVLTPPVLNGHRGLRTLLVPLDGPSEAVGAISAAVDLALDTHREVVFLHVHELHDLPLVTDQPQYESEAWGRAFLQRRFPRRDDVRLEVRVGRAADQLCTVASEIGADMILLGWSQRLGAGRAVVVQAALSSAALPVMLVPSRTSSGRVVPRTNTAGATR